MPHPALLQPLLDDIATLEDRWRLPWSSVGEGPSVWEHTAVRAARQAPLAEREELMSMLFLQPQHVLRALGLQILSESPFPRFLPLAREMLDDDEWGVRAMAAKALAKHADKEALDRLLDTLDSEHSEVKKVIVDALAALRDAKAVPLLTRWVGRAGEDDQLRLRACEALGQIGDEAAMPLLTRVMGDETVADRVRFAACEAAGRIGGAQARSLLMSQLGTARGAFKGAVLKALAKTGGQETLRVLLPYAGPNEDPLVRGLALEALHRLDPTAAAAIARDLLDDPEAALRREVALCIGRVSWHDLLPPLRAALEDRDPNVRAAAVWAAARLNGRETAPVPHAGLAPAVPTAQAEGS